MTVDLDEHLGGIQSGDAAAFGRWMSRAEPSLRGGLKSFARVVDTEAVLQEALLRVWQVAPGFVPDGRPNGLLRLAARIARNLAVSELRRARVHPAEIEALERSLAAEGEVPAAPDPHLRRRIQECRDQLPAKPAQALAARLEQVGLPDLTLAEALGMTKNTFLQNFTRARKFLMECLKKAGVDLEGELA